MSKFNSRGLAIGKSKELARRKSIGTVSAVSNPDWYQIRRLDFLIGYLHPDYYLALF